MSNIEREEPPVLRILVLTGILPIDEIQKKKNENDIILEYERQLKSHGYRIEFQYGFTLPYSNSIIGFFSKKWRSYAEVQQGNRVIHTKGNSIFPLGILVIPRLRFLDNLLYPVSYFFNRKVIKELIKSYEPNIIHAQNADGDSYLARRIFMEFGIPYITTLRSMRKSKIVSRNLEHASRLIAISPTQRRLASEMTNKRINLIPHGVDEKFFVSKSNKRELDHPSLGPIRIVTICKLIKLKNVESVIRALSLFEHIDFVYDIYGQGPQYMYLQELIRTLKLETKVTLKGAISNMELTGILRNYDLFILLSYPESLGRVYLEAMASGVPIIATKNTGVDGIIQDGREGFLINRENSVEELYLVLNKLFEDPKMLEGMSLNSKCLAEGFSWDSVAMELVSVYRNLL
jgi:glycosyltransferase involved in cell wall biosynthesis